MDYMEAAVRIAAGENLNVCTSCGEVFECKPEERGLDSIECPECDGAKPDQPSKEGKEQA